MAHRDIHENKMRDSTVRKQSAPETWEQATAKQMASDKSLAESLRRAMDEATIDLSELRDDVNRRRRNHLLRTTGA